MSNNAGTHTINERFAGRLNALFKLRSRQTVYRLTYLILLQVLGGATVQGVERMLHVGWPTNIDGIVVRIAAIKRTVHLIPLEAEKRWLVNDRIDMESWNMI